MSISVHTVRGNLPPDSLGSRGIEHYGRNPGCERLAVITAAQLLPNTILTQVYGQPDEEQAAPFAIILGNQFESHLFQDGAARLLDLYEREHRLCRDERHVVNIEELVPGTKPKDLTERVKQTMYLLEQKLRRDPAAPNLIVKPRFEVEVMGARYAVEPDFIVARATDPFYLPGEIKSYPDRGGKTSGADIRSGCRQAAVGLVALRQAVASLGTDYDAVPAACDLILKRPGSFIPTLRPMTLEREVTSLEYAMQILPATYAKVTKSLSGTLDDPHVVMSVQYNYTESCKEFCALASVCKEQAQTYGAPSLLGNTAREVLSAAGSLERALELLSGRGLPPHSPEEALLQARLQEADVLYEEALCHV